MMQVKSAARREYSSRIAKRHDDYVVISPCRDESQHCRATLDCMVAQSVRPSLWVIVDDGSSDATPSILTEYAQIHDWIQVVRREDRGRRAVGPGVIDAFYAGLHEVDLSQFGYICKLDLDLDLPHDYFARLIERMEADPRLGTCSGKPYFRHPRSGQLISEKCGNDMSVGMTKFYRTKCFEQIGGFVREVMWDGIDCHKCRMLGWKACSWDDPELRFIHLRPMGSSQHGIWTGRMRHGYGQYFMGTGMAYMTASAVYRMTCPPYVVGGLAMWLGYCLSKVKGAQRHEDSALRHFIRRYQRLALLNGKASAIEQLEAEGELVWQEDRKTAQPGCGGILA